MERASEEHLGKTTILSTIYDYARRTPEKTAVVHNGVAYTYAGFAQSIEQARRYFAALDMEPGLVAILLITKIINQWVLGLALRSLGLHTIVIKSIDAIEQRESRQLGYIITVEDDPLWKNITGNAAWKAINVPQKTLTGDERLPLDPPTARPGGHIMLTSGTTGFHKKAMWDVEEEVKILPLLAKIYEITTASTVYMGNVALWTGGGHHVPIVTWAAGGTIILHQRPDMGTPLKEHRITHMYSTPHILSSLLQTSNDLVRNDEMRIMNTGGAMSKELYLTAKERLTANIMSTLSCTETSVFGVTPIESPDDLLWHHIHPLREVQVVDDADNPLGPGKEGCIRVRIDALMTGYLDDEEASRKYFRDGYFYTGDIGMWRDDGRLGLFGRTSDVINILGHKSAAGPFEHRMRDRLNANEVCILSIQNTNGGQALYILIQPGQPITQSEIEHVGNDVLAPLRRLPIHVILVKRLPRTETGKVMRCALQQELMRDPDGEHLRQ
jgi:acyl-coenzyme A synthetase/AMP-(fatty) acid ligase